MTEHTDKKIFISCKMATKLMSKSMEERLSFFEKAQLKAHLFICKTCVFCFKQIKSVSQTLNHYIDAICKTPPVSGKTLSDSAKNKMKQALLK